MMGKLVVDSIVHLGQAVQGRRFPLRPDGPPPQGQHPRRAGGAGRADASRRTASTARRSCSTARAGTSARSPTTPASCRPPRPTWPAPASAPSTTGCATRCAAAARSTATRASRASPPGLYTDPNGDAGQRHRPAEQRARLLHYQDLIKVGLTGNLADYRFVDAAGAHGHRRAGRLQRLAGRLHRRARRGDHLRGRARQRDPVRRARLQAAAGTSADATGRGCRCWRWRTTVLRAGHRLRRGRHRPAAVQVAGPQLLQLRRLVQPDPLGLRPGQRLRARPAAGRRQRATSGPSPGRCWPTRRWCPAATRSTWRPPATRNCCGSAAASPVFGLGTADEVQERLSFPLSGPRRDARA